MSVKLNLVNVYLRNSVLLVYTIVQILSRRHYCHEVSNLDRFSRLQCDNSDVCMFSHRWNWVNYPFHKRIETNETKIRKRKWKSYFCCMYRGERWLECFIFFIFFSLESRLFVMHLLHNKFTFHNVSFKVLMPLES